MLVGYITITKYRSLQGYKVIRVTYSRARRTSTASLARQTTRTLENRATLERTANVDVESERNKFAKIA